jgi:HAD superfamily phosphatase (TIGR01668 family)
LYKLLCPRLIVKSINDIDTKKLRSLRINGLIFDLDNTIIPWDSKNMPQDISLWLRHLLDLNYKVCLVSNNRKRRVKEIAGLFGIPFIHRAFKPAKTGFRKAIRAMDLPPEEVAVIGDQLFTDILGGNRLGLFTIWVSPLTAREFIFTKMTRQLERVTVYLLRQKGLIK